MKDVANDISLGVFDLIDPLKPASDLSGTYEAIYKK